MGKRGLVVLCIALLVQCNLCLSFTHYSARVEMSKQQSCYYQPNNKELVCQCREGEDKSYMDLRLREFIIQAGQEITSILLHSCPDLLLHLDFHGVNPTPIQTTVRNSQDIRIESVSFDQKYKDRQQLKMAFSNVGSLTFSNLSITEALELEVTNVKKLLIINSTFSHIPRRGLRVSRTGKLEIRNSTFNKVYPMSVVVEKTKVVEVINNKFSTDAIQVISYKDGSSVFISCNRLLGDYIKPECFTTTTVMTTSTTTTKTTTITTTTTSQPITTTRRAVAEPAQQSVLLLTILVILLFLLIIFVLFVVTAICYANWTRIKKELGQLTSAPPELDKEEEAEPLQVVAIPIPPPPPPTVEMETLLNPQHSTKQQLFAPVWMQEIQNNKIFNKQKSINQDLNGNENQNKSPIVNHVDANNTLNEHDVDDIAPDADYKENSRTESDQDD